MKRRSQADWKALFEQQTASNLSVAEFCKEHSIGQSYFYKRKSDLIGKGDRSSNKFIKIKPQPKNLAPISSIKIQHQQTRLSFSVTISAIWLADFVKALA